jgi:hypothetical protein
MLRRVALVRTDVSEELFRASVVPNSPILVTLMKEKLSSSETSVLTRATQPNIPEDTSLHIQGRENLKFYIVGSLVLENQHMFYFRNCHAVCFIFKGRIGTQSQWKPIPFSDLSFDLRAGSIVYCILCVVFSEPLCLSCFE